SAQLAAVAHGVGDAFEVALLDAVTGASLAGGAFSDGDALLNLQADGRLHLGAGVTIDGQPGFVSGDVVDLAQPITISIDISAIAPNTSAALFFDLITMSDASSTVAIDDVTIQITDPNNAAPSAGNDTATTNEDEPVLIDVLGNDSDSDGTISPNDII